MEKQYEYLFSQETAEFCAQLESINRRERFCQLGQELLSRVEKTLADCLAVGECTRKEFDHTRHLYQTEVLQDFSDAYKSQCTSLEGLIRQRVKASMTMRLLQRFEQRYEAGMLPRLLVLPDELGLEWRTAPNVRPFIEIILLVNTVTNLYTVLARTPTGYSWSTSFNETIAFIALHQALAKEGFAIP
jgi:hypothetical protein